jgi:peptidoglycan hydrolase-like protein with peptidoglycan-binding domain
VRFSEFKIIKEATATTNYYTIGDSHAVAVAKAGGKNWINLAIGGRSSTDSAMLANISQIPKGAVVLVSQGANDTANAARAHMDSQGKKPIRRPQEIANNVANVVNKVQAQGATVIFMLFPNGPGRGAGLAKYYGGDYQNEVREAIKSAIGNVEIIDINGKPLPDGVHAGMSTYREVANQVTKTKPQAVPVGGKPTAGAFVVGVPTKNRGPEVADLQKALVALGFPLPKFGIDGIRGSETSGAVRDFQKANNLPTTGNPDEQTIAQINAVLATKPEIASKLTKSTDADVKPGGRSGKDIDVSAIQDPDFNRKLEKIARELGVSSKDLIAVMKLESGVKSTAQNKQSGATGLIQFMPKTAAALGTTTDELLKMTAVEQLDYVYKYFKMVGLKPGSDLQTIYMAVFMPAAMNKGPDHVLGQRGAAGFSGKVYDQNSGLDRNKDGTITVADAAQSVQRFA